MQDMDAKLQLVHSQNVATLMSLTERHSASTAVAQNPKLEYLPANHNLPEKFTPSSYYFSGDAATAASKHTHMLSKVFVSLPHSPKPSIWVSVNYGPIWY